MSTTLTGTGGKIYVSNSTGTSNANLTSWTADYNYIFTGTTNAHFTGKYKTPLWLDYETVGTWTNPRHYTWDTDTTVTCTVNGTYWAKVHGGFTTPQKPSSRLAQILQSRRGPTVIVRDRLNPYNGALGHATDIREQRARQTLRHLVGEDQYRRFLSKGFVSAQNKQSGRVYQIFTGHGITRVYDNGVLVEKLCVYLKGDFTPTDTTIFRYLLALNDEDRLWSLSNKHGRNLHRAAPHVADLRPAAEIFKQLKSQSQNLLNV